MWQRPILLQLGSMPTYDTFFIVLVFSVLATLEQNDPLTIAREQLGERWGVGWDDRVP